MTPNRLQEQLTKYLTDAHSIEEQALVQMRSAPKIAGDPEISAAFEAHLAETEAHESIVRQRLEARDAAPAKLKDLAGRVTGRGFALFARVQPDTPGKLVTHAYSYEHMELAAYELLTMVAERAGDAETAGAAQRIRVQGDAMSERLTALFDRAVDASLRDQDPKDLGEQLNTYLSDAHALESQAVTLLERARSLAGTPRLATANEKHLSQTQEQRRLIEERLQARGAGTNKLKDAALSLGALNWGLFFAAQPDTPAKLAGFATRSSISKLPPTSCYGVWRSEPATRKPRRWHRRSIRSALRRSSCSPCLVKRSRPLWTSKGVGARKAKERKDPT